MLTLQIQHLGQRELLVLRMRCFGPDRAAALSQPGVELHKRAKPLGASLYPDTPAAVLHVLLHHPFLPARGHVAKVRLEQVVAAQRIEAGIDDATFAFLDLVHRRLHVVINAPARHTAQRRKTAGVRVKQHLVPLAGVGHHPEGPTGAQLEM